ncbi:MAG: HNH endonuclease [Planctomycetaceae bacterium]|nr:HNH endonuclease [Planctomycetaceae bacterium]
MTKKADKPRERTKLPLKTLTIVLTEAGYRCAVPTCRGILALDMHHIWEVSAGGGDDPSNLIALCPTCHALYHRSTIAPDSIYAYKAMLVAIGRAFDVEAIDKLLFLYKIPNDQLVVSGDGVLQFARLIAADLAEFKIKNNNNWLLATYAIRLTEKGRLILHAWMQGDRNGLKNALFSETMDIASFLGEPQIVMAETGMDRDKVTNLYVESSGEEL